MFRNHTYRGRPITAVSTERVCIDFPLPQNADGTRLIVVGSPDEGDVDLMIEMLNLLKAATVRTATGDAPSRTERRSES